MAFSMYYSFFCCSGFLVVSFCTVSSSLPLAERERERETERKHFVTSEPLWADEGSCDAATVFLQTAQLSISSAPKKTSASSLTSDGGASVIQGVDANGDADTTRTLMDQGRISQGVSDRSRVALHVGPPKTGTSTVQHGMESIRHFLQKDGIELFRDVEHLPDEAPSWLKHVEGGNGIMSRCFDDNCNILDQFQDTNFQCFWAHKHMCPTLKENLRQLIMTSAASTIVISSEHFGTAQNISRLASTLEGINTTVIVGFRPFYDLFGSVYRQICHSKAKQSKISENGVLPPMAFNEYATTNRIQQDFDKRSSQATYKRYQQHFQDITYHEMNDDLVANIICEDLAASQSCKQVRRQTAPRENVRKHQNFTGDCLDADRLKLLFSLSMQEGRFFASMDKKSGSRFDELTFEQRFNQSFASCFGMR